MSCLTAPCHVYPGSSVLCNLKLVFNAQPCLYIERRLQREGREIQRNKHCHKKTAGDWVNCGLYCINGSSTGLFIITVAWVHRSKV